MTALPPTFPAEMTRNDAITAQSETPNPVTYSSETHYENKSLPAGGTQVTVVHSADILPGPEIKENDQHQSDYLANAEETARKYLPTRVVDALEGVGVMGNGSTNSNKPTLPSQETSFQPSSGGVGSLPGNQSEVSVAKLPEERALEEQVGRPLGREGVIGTVADPQNVDSIRTRMDNPLTPAAQFSDPITEPFPQSGDGVALQHLARPDVASTEHNRPLPTLINAQLTPVSETPGEPEHERDFGSKRESEHGHEHAAKQENKKSSNSADINKPLPNETDQAAPPPQARDKHPDASNEKDTSKSYSSDQAARRAPKTTPGDSHKEILPKNMTSNHNQTHSQTDGTSSVDGDSKKSSDTGDKDGSARKPSLSQKIKGEVKVISGKLSKDQAKVESGQALKQGLAT